MANIVVCCDGTWNTPDDMDGGVPAPTNVVKIYNALDEKDANGDAQKKYYHPGVGTDGGFVDWALGGGLGKGLDENIKSAYRWLAVNYRPDDRIFLLGFSRGAYTVRSLGGMIGRCGLLDLSDPALSTKDTWDRVALAFDCYRAKPNSADQKKCLAALKKLKTHNKPASKLPTGTTPIYFVGVWDTVGALGIPDDLALLNILDNPEDHSFHDTDLSKSVLNARHAVAVDEKRQSFVPTLWTNVDNRKEVKQLWFPGVHSDVGGGYGVTGLSDGALKWMMDEVQPLGLKFRQGIDAQLKPDPRGLLHDSMTGIFTALKAIPRNVPNFNAGTAADSFHASALDRYQNFPIQQPAYWPTATIGKNDPRTVDVFARQRWNATGFFLEDGAEYDLTAKGEWVDRELKCGPDGMNDGDFKVGELLHVALSALGKAETLYRKLTGNMQTDFWGTKRHEDIPWFALVGVVANGLGVDQNKQLIPHMVFKIGNKLSLKLPKGQPGYLYCYANDAWAAYGNNKGSVSLTVKRTS